jgi:hypothetical protein
MKSLNFFKNLPKLELHAHLSGSMRLDTFKEFLADSNIRINKIDLS